MKNIPTATRLRVSAMSVHPTPLNKIWIIAIHHVSRTPLARTRRPRLGSVGGWGVNAGSFDPGSQGPLTPGVKVRARTPEHMPSEYSGNQARFANAVSDASLFVLGLLHLGLRQIWAAV